MKVFISADIEGCCGVFSNIETHKNEAVYAPFAKQMTKEVLAVCEAAHEAGADEIVVKDGHGDASNIDPLQMPSYVTLIRGKSGHPYNMMFGLDPTFDAVLYVGYHAAAGCPEFAVSHTSTGNSLYITLNGKRMSEFMLNSFTAASLGVPVAFISGDEAICAAARSWCRRSPQYGPSAESGTPPSAARRKRSWKPSGSRRRRLWEGSAGAMWSFRKNSYTR